MKEYVCKVKVTVDTEGEINLEELKDYLKDAVILDLDTEEYGDFGVNGLEIDWDSLKEEV